jgi:hypothetical protein
MKSDDIAQATDMEVSQLTLGTASDPFEGVVMRLTLLHRRQRVQTEAISFSVQGARALAVALLAKAQEAEAKAARRSAH